MSTVLFWFRNDLRVHDNPSLYQAVQAARQAGVPLWLCYVHDPAQQAPTRWGFVRQGVHRRVFLRQTLDDLQQQAWAWNACPCGCMCTALPTSPTAKSAKNCG